MAIQINRSRSSCRGIIMTRLLFSLLILCIAPPPNLLPFFSSSSSSSPSSSSMLFMVDALAEDWLDEDTVLETVYQQRPIRVQNMDYDQLNNMFLAHSIWYNNLELHAYLFRQYTPAEYPNVTFDSAANVPIQKIYFVTVTGQLNDGGVVGKPIIQYHNGMDGSNYSDFMEIYLVTAPAVNTTFFEPDMLRSELDVLESGFPIAATGIIINMPVVPTNAKLQHPGQDGTRRAPIDPVQVWYKGKTVWTYVFEVSDQSAADFFNATRQDGSGPAFAITVMPAADWASPSTGVAAMPAWFLNQYTNGVMMDEDNDGVRNAGGPLATGMRNIVQTDRNQSGYSPLWQLQWVTVVPTDFAADQVSHMENLTEANGFRVVPTNFFFNCPHVGDVGTEFNPNMKLAGTFLNSVTGNQDVSIVQGADVSQAFTTELTNEFRMNTADNTVLGTATTNELGGYQLQVRGRAIPNGVTLIYMYYNGMVLRTIDVKDYLSVPPPTVYETTSEEEDQVTAENMDYDRINKIFLTHAVWYNDRLVHQYKFRIYGNQTYPNVIPADAGANATSNDLVPTQKLYIMSNSLIDGMVGRPVLQYHHVDGTKYSDFVEIVFVRLPNGYVADQFRSEGDIVLSGAQQLSSGTFVNLPVVPIGAKLQDPARQGTRTLEIAPFPVWYKGVEIWTYAFEATDDLTANYLNTLTRPALSSDRDYRISKADFASGSGGVTSAPLWFLNAFTRGVTAEAANNGGPWSSGMRNIINVDRQDVGYSPLWHLQWMVEIPINMEADAVSNAADITPTNGFAVTPVPYFMNAPTIGQVRGQINPKKATVFSTTVDPFATFSWIMGSATTLPFTADKTVEMETLSGSTVQTAQTNVMGGYELNLLTLSIPPGNRQLQVVLKGAKVELDQTIRTVDVPDDKAKTSGGAATTTITSLSFSSYYAAALLGMVLFVVTV